MPSQSATVGDAVAAFLEAQSVTCAFGVISIHNMPILDAIARRGRIRFVPARGEAGALNMADAFARVSGGLGVGVTSTGVAAGNAAGSLIEARTAGTGLLHLTGQVETAYLDRAKAYIHEAPCQPDMLKAVSKAYFRVWSQEEALGVLREAAATALTPPAGPVSVEIPIDVQAAPVRLPDTILPISVSGLKAGPAAIDRAADMIAAAKRPLMLLGGGARGATGPALRLAELGFGIATSVNGRGIVPEVHPMCFGAFAAAAEASEFLASCDTLLVVGSRLRGNETLKYSLELPRPLIQIDIDPAMDSRTYPSDLFVHGDAAEVLAGLADRLGGRLQIDNSFGRDLADSRAAAVEGLRRAIGPAHAAIVDQLRAGYPAGAPWVRDITLSNSTWGNRYVDLDDPRQGVHSLGGAIGQGLPMAIGAALAASDGRAVALVGDGGFMLSAGELATAVQERAAVTVILMNDRGYGVIRNIQDARFGGRRHYADLATPDFGSLCASLGVPHQIVRAPDDFGAAFAAALEEDGPAIVEVDLTAVGPFSKPFAGPPVRKAV